MLFTRGAITGGRARIYSDNIALARWLQEGVQGSMRDTYSGSDIPVIDAAFDRDGDTQELLDGADRDGRPVDRADLV